MGLYIGVKFVIFVSFVSSFGEKIFFLGVFSRSWQCVCSCLFKLSCPKWLFGEHGFTLKAGNTYGFRSLCRRIRGDNHKYNRLLRNSLSTFHCSCRAWGRMDLCVKKTQKHSSRRTSNDSHVILQIKKINFH